MNFKDVCGEAESVWFVLSDKRKEGRRFLKWAKELGCVWLNGREIEPNGGTEFFVLSISSRGTLANVPAMAVASKQFQGIKRIPFKDFRKATSMHRLRTRRQR